MAEVVLAAEVRVVLALLGLPMVVVARHRLHHTHYPRIQLAQDLRLSSPLSYLTPRSAYWPSSVQRWHVSSLPAHPQPTSNNSQHFIEPYPVPQVMLCVSEREIVCTRVAGLACTGVRTRVWACVCVCTGMRVCMGWCMCGSLCMVHLYVLGFVCFLRVLNNNVA